MKKRLLSTLLALCMMLSLLPGTAWAASSGTCGNNLTWTLTDDGTLTISGTGSMDDYSSYSNDPPWYDHHEQIHAVSIGNGVTTIGKSAFHNCWYLTSVTISDSVTTIGEFAFAYCDSLTSVTIPDSVISIGEGAFECCIILTDINVASRNPAYTSIDGILFSADGTVLHTYPMNRPPKTYSIPASVTTISGYAFYNCLNLTSVDIPKGVTRIGDSAFNACLNLTSVTIPNSVINIGDYAFCFCRKLTSVTIPDSVISIAVGAFEGCSSLNSVTIPVSVTSIDQNAFAQCESLTDVYYGGNESQWGQIDFIMNGNGNDLLLNANIHFNSKGPGDSDTSPSAPSGFGTYTELSPANGATGFGKDAPDQVGVAADQFAMSFDRPLLVTHNQPVLDFSKGTIALHSADGKLLWEAKTYNSDNTCTDIVVMGSTDNKAFAIRPINLQTGALLDYDSTYYITVDPGVIQFADGSVMDGIAKGEWEFSTIQKVTASEPPFSTTFTVFFDEGSALVDWNEEWLQHPATTYIHKLAVASAALSAAAEEETSAKIDSALKSLDFEDVSSEDFDWSVFKDDWSDGSAGYTIAHKTITAGSESFTLIAIVVRGSKNPADWASNFFDNGLINGDSGFEDAAKGIIQALKTYCSDRDIDYSDNVKFLVTGHSRGGLIANIVAAELGTRNIIDGAHLNQRISQTNVYGYTFAPPKPSTGAVQLDCSNIWNIINYPDVVPKIPPTNSSRYGTDLYLPNKAYYANYKKFSEPMYAEFKHLTGDDYIGDIFGLVAQ